jgi:hypothetical protein
MRSSFSRELLASLEYGFHIYGWWLSEGDARIWHLVASQASEKRKKIVLPRFKIRRYTQLSS